MASRACCSYRTWLFLSVLLLTLARLFGVWESLLQGLLLLIGVRLEEVPELPELPDLKSFASFHLGGGGGTPAQSGLAAFTFQFQTYGDWTAQRLQLVLGMTTAVIWGAQVIIPDSQPAQTANFLDFAPGDGWDRRNLFTSLYSFQDQEEHLRKVFKDYWCRPQQRSSPAADLWCSQDGLPSILNRSTAQKLLRETLTPQTVRQCEDTAPLGAASKAFGAQTWSYWTHSDGSNVMKPLNIEMVKCDCTFANVEALELSDQDLEIFWKVDATLKFADHILDAVRQLKSGLQKYNVTARENAERLGYQRPHSLGSPRFHVLQLLRHDPCDEEEAMRRDNCMNNTMEVGNLMLAEGVDPTLPVYLMGAETSGADLLPADAHARAMESLKKIYTLVSKEMIFLDASALTSAALVAVDFVLASEAEFFVGNSIPDISGYLIMLRDARRDASKTLHYNGGSVPLADRLGVSNQSSLQDTTFRLPIKWIFSLGVTAEYALAHSTSGAALAVATDFNELRRTQIALRSALAYAPGIVPICVTTAAIGSPLAKWLLQNGARVIYHSPAWSSEALQGWKDFGCEGGAAATAAKTNAALSEVLRMDAVALGLPDEFLLLTGNTMIFTKDVTWTGLLGESKQSKLRMKKNDFAHGKFNFAKSRETGVPRYFAMSCGVRQSPEPMDASVMLINRRVMRDTYPRFVRYVLSKLKQSCHPNLAEFYRKFYREKDKDSLANFLPSIYNWRPFWAPNPSVAINNFEGFDCRGTGGAPRLTSTLVGNITECTMMGSCDMLCDLVHDLTWS